MPLTFLELKQRIREEIWPKPGEPKSLRTAHDKFFIEAMIDLQRSVKCLQVHNTTVFKFCSTYYDCGKTVTDSVGGQIRRVYTVANGDFCDRVLYESLDCCELEAYANQMCSSLIVSESAKAALQQGLRYANAERDTIRARSGRWAVCRDRLNLFPWIQSNEDIIVEWEGVKKAWNDSDILEEDGSHPALWDASVEAAIRAYVKWCDERDFGCNAQDIAIRLQVYQEARADLISDCRIRTEKQLDQCLEARFPTSAQLADDVVPEDTRAVKFAVIGDYGTDGDGPSDVAAYIRDTVKPDFIATTGDNFYGSGTAIADFDLIIGPLYHQFLFPYLGDSGEVATEQKFFPAIGNHDRDPAGKYQTHLDYFNLSKPYYDVLKFPVHLFFVDSGLDSASANQQDDGITFDSTQGRAVQLAMSQSTAPWKLVFFHHPAKTSGLNHGEYPTMDWPFKEWGAAAVFNGHEHSYERLSVNGLPHFVMGASGQTPLTGFGAPSGDSVTRYNADWGFLQVDATKATLTVKFINRSGVTVDSVTLIK